jgi:hypothetical protein
MNKENIPDYIPEVIVEELGGRKYKRRWVGIGVKVLGAVTIVIVALVLTNLYLNNQSQSKQAEIEKQEQSEKAYKELDQSNSEYLKKMNPICSKPVNEITALDFFKCKVIKDDYFIDLKLDLENPDLPSFCKRKIQELIANELIECLEEKLSP